MNWLYCIQPLYSARGSYQFLRVLTRPKKGKKECCGRGSTACSSYQRRLMASVTANSMIFSTARKMLRATMTCTISMLSRYRPVASAGGTVRSAKMKIPSRICSHRGRLSSFFPTTVVGCFDLAMNRYGKTGFYIPALISSQFIP